MSAKKVIIVSGALLVIGGILFWYYKHKKGQAAVATGAAGPSATAPSSPAQQPAGGTAVSSNINPLPATAPETGDPVRNALISMYTGLNKPREVSIINNADAETLRLWAVIVNCWSTGQDPYKTDTQGRATGDFNNSIGKWWELFSARNGI